MNIRKRIPDRDDPHLISMVQKHLGGYLPEKVGKARIEQKLDQASEVLVLSDERGKTAGFICYRLKNDKLFVDLAILDTEYQGKKIASSLFPVFLNHARKKGALAIRCIVHRRNKKAIAIFQNWGFAVIRFYPIHNTVLMEKKI